MVEGIWSVRSVVDVATVRCAEVDAECVQLDPSALGCAGDALQFVGPTSMPPLQLLHLRYRARDK